MKKSIIACLLVFLIIPVFSQDYVINFDGQGAATNVEKVTVDNLTQGTSLTFNGTEQLHLKADINRLDAVFAGSEYLHVSFQDKNLSYIQLQFIVPLLNEVQISVFEQSGRVVLQNRYQLSFGEHTCELNGLTSGFYTVRVSSKDFDYAAKFLCKNKSFAKPSMSYKGFSTTTTIKRQKADSPLVQMQYKSGDLLKFTGYSGSNSTIVTDIPTTTKTISFYFAECRDGDGNNYPIVKIGSQIWMAENLKTSRYNTGDTIRYESNNTNWYLNNVAAFCWYDHDEVINKNKYGGLYNWYALKTNNLAPVGWHVPTDAEWITLENYLMSNRFNYDGTTSGNKYSKSLASTNLWNPSTVIGTVGNTDYPSKRNATGFTAIPTGYRNYKGLFSNIGNATFIWSSTQTNESMAYSRSISNVGYLVVKSEATKNSGFTIRCLKD